MPRYKVIKAHDGLQVGDIRTLPASSVTAYMCAQGYWREITPKNPKVQENKKD